MTSSNPSYVPRPYLLITLYRGSRVSTYKLWGATNIHSITLPMKMCSSLLFSFPVNFHGRQTRNLKFTCDFFIFLISSGLINSAPLKYVMCLLFLFIAFTSCQIYFISFLNDPFVPSTFIFLYTSHLKDYSYLRMLICSVNPFLSIQGPS